MKKELVEKPDKESSILKLLRSTKHFFGIDQTDDGTNTSQQQESNAEDGSPSSSTQRKQQQQQHNSPIYHNKALTNWNERTFRVLKSNAVFGGKLKKEALPEYISNLDDTTLKPDDDNEANMFLYYKKTGGESLDLPKRTGLTDIAIDEMKKVLKVRHFFLLFRQFWSRLS